jgi:hypothetical protein
MESPQLFADVGASGQDSIMMLGAFLLGAMGWASLRRCPTGRSRSKKMLNEDEDAVQELGRSMGKPGVAEVAPSEATGPDGQSPRSTLEEPLEEPDPQPATTERLAVGAGHTLKKARKAKKAGQSKAVDESMDPLVCFTSEGDASSTQASEGPIGMAECAHERQEEDGQSDSTVMHEASSDDIAREIELEAQPDNEHVPSVIEAVVAATAGAERESTVPENNFAPPAHADEPCNSKVEPEPVHPPVEWDGRDSSTAEEGWEVEWDGRDSSTVEDGQEDEVPAWNNVYDFAAPDDGKGYGTGPLTSSISRSTPQWCKERAWQGSQHWKSTDNWSWKESKRESWSWKDSWSSNGKKHWDKWMQPVAESGAAASLDNVCWHWQKWGCCPRMGKCNWDHPILEESLPPPPPPAEYIEEMIQVGSGISPTAMPQFQCWQFMEVPAFPAPLSPTLPNSIHPPLDLDAMVPYGETMNEAEAVQCRQQGEGAYWEDWEEERILESDLQMPSPLFNGWACFVQP